MEFVNSGLNLKPKPVKITTPELATRASLEPRTGNPDSATEKGSP